MLFSNTKRHGRWRTLTGRLARQKQCLSVIKQTRANACLFNARDTSLTVAWFRVFTSSFLYLRGFVVHTKTMFTRVNIFTLAVVFKFTRFVWSFTRLRVDGSRNRENIYAFSRVRVDGAYMSWTFCDKIFKCRLRYRVWKMKFKNSFLYFCIY